MRRIVHSPITIVVALYIGLIVLALFSDRLMFQAQASSYRDSGLLAAAKGMGVQDAQIFKLQSAAYVNGRKKTDPETITAVLVIQGDADEVVPFWHGQKIFELANEPKRSLWIHGAHHNDVLFTATTQYLDALKEFAKTLK